MANRTPTPPQGGTARTAAADLDLSTPPLPGFESIAPPLRVRRGGPSSVHTLESNVTDGRQADPNTELDWKDWKRVRSDARNYPAYGRDLRDHGVDVGYVPPPPAAPGEIAFRHAWWAEKRALVRAGLERIGASSRVLERFDNCGSDCWVYANKKTGDLRLHANTCKNRFCDPCQITRSRILGGNIADELERRRYRKFLHVVLTLKSSTLPLGEQITACMRAFRALRNYKTKIKVHPDDAKLKSVRWWGQYVAGGVVTFEPMGHKKTALFHPHLHLIVECTKRAWIPHGELSEAWRVCTRGVNPKLESEVVWIQRLDSYEAAAAEVAKYASKGIAELAEHFITDRRKLDECLKALKGRRMVTTFGTWRSITLTDTPEYEAEEWCNLGPLIGLMAKSDGGDDRAARILEILRAQVQKTPRPPPVASPN